MKMFVVLLLIFCSSIGFISCNNGSGSKISSEDSLKIYNAFQTKMKPQSYHPSIFSKVDSTTNKLYSVDDPGGKVIDWKTAKPMIESFRVESRFDDYPLQTEHDGPLHGYYIKKEAFDTIFTNKSSTGVAIYFAKHIGAPERVYTLVLVGTNRTPGTRASKDNTNIVWEEIDPCPTLCGDGVPE